MHYFFINEKLMEHILQIKNFLIKNYGLELQVQNINPNTFSIEADFPISFLKKALIHHFPDFKFQLNFQIKAAPTQMPGFKLKNIQNTIAVVSGKGGVGKSTVSCNLAVATQQLGARVGLLDADIYGPSLPTMMGIHTKPEITEDQRYLPPVAHHVECMSMGLLQEDGPLIWRGPMLAKALIQMLDTTTWSELDYLYLDLPPGTGDIPLSLVQKIPLSGAIIVTTPQTIATLDAEKAIQMFIKTNVPILGIVSNMTWHECQSCHDKNYIFGHDGAKNLARKYMLPLLGEIPLVTKIRESSDEGNPIASLQNHPLYQTWQETVLNITQILSQKSKIGASKFPPIRQE